MNHASTRATAGGMAPAAKAKPRKRNPTPGGYSQPIRNVRAKERAAVLADVAAAEGLRVNPAIYRHALTAARVIVTYPSY